MRQIRSSGLEGAVEFKPPSLPLFYRPNGPTMFLFVLQRRGEHAPTRRKPPTRAAEKQKEKVGTWLTIYKQAIPTGFGRSPKSKSYALREEMSVIIREHSPISKRCRISRHAGPASHRQT